MIFCLRPRETLKAIVKYSIQYSLMLSELEVGGTASTNAVAFSCMFHELSTASLVSLKNFCLIFFSQFSFFQLSDSPDRRKNKTHAMKIFIIIN